jgi:DNA replication protein DnaC
VEDIPDILRLAYIETVNQRQIPFQETPEVQEYIAKVAKWLVSDNYKPGLLLYGQVGNGKTTMAKAACQTIGMLYDSVYGNERKGVWQISALDLSAIARNDADRFERIKKTELLFVDDLGCESVTVKSWGNEFSPVVELLYYRYDRQLFTIVSSNLSDNDFNARYGARIDDRIREMFDRLSFTNGSFRQCTGTTRITHSEPRHSEPVNTIPNDDTF